MSHTLEAMAGSLAALRPTFTTFYGLLDDEQKARLVAMGMSNDASGKQDVASKRSGSKRDSLCQQWVINLRSWPVRQIEDGTSLSDQQHATLHELTAAIYRAAGRLGTSCNADDRFTPPGRLEARQDQLPAREFWRGVKLDRAPRCEPVAVACSQTQRLADPRKCSLFGPKRRFAASQPYVRSWG